MGQGVRGGPDPPVVILISGFDLHESSRSDTDFGLSAKSRCSHTSLQGLREGDIYRAYKKAILSAFDSWYIARYIYIVVQDRRHLVVDQALGAGDKPRAIRAAPRPHPQPCSSRLGACVRVGGSGRAVQIARGAQHASSEIELSYPCIPILRL